jgi:transposase
MLHAGLALSRAWLDVCLLNQDGATVEVTAVPPDADGLRGPVGRVGNYGQPVQAAIESMNGARFVHDQLELAGWQVQIADAQKVKGRLQGRWTARAPPAIGRELPPPP